MDMNIYDLPEADLGFILVEMNYMFGTEYSKRGVYEMYLSSEYNGRLAYALFDFECHYEAYVNTL